MSRTLRHAFLACLPLLALTAPGYAQRTDTSGLVESISWRNIGPAIMGGRIDDFAVVESDPRTYYVATAAGGIFKTSNHGTTWESIFDNEVTSSIGDIAIAPSNPNVVYVGTGEANNRQSSSWGYGMYRSEDAGKTWTHLGLEKTQHIGRVVVDPTNPDTVYVAALGRLWGPNPERGLYKSTDGGKTWTLSLFINDDTGVTDVVMDPSDPNTLYAAAYTRRRTAFGFVGGSKDGGLFKTTDGGKTWKKLQGGLPDKQIGRIGITIYPKNPKILYITAETDNQGGTQSAQGNGNVWRTDDGGETWQRRANTNPRPMYFSQIRVDPNDSERVYVTGVEAQVSTNGGQTFNTAWGRSGGNVHADGHALWIDPKDSNHVLYGNDGGVAVTWDRGKTWDYLNNFVCSQFYEVHFDFALPYHVYGGLQDNGSWTAPKMTLMPGRGVTNDEWLNINGGDGFFSVADPSNPDIVYTESQNGAVRRLHQATGEAKSIRPRQESPNEELHFDWNSPIHISPHNPRKIFFGGNKLFISYDRGDNWRRTEDLTGKPDRTKMPILGQLVDSKPGGTLSANDGQDTFGSIETISESPAKEGVIWIGTDDGYLRVSQDDGKSWTLCTVPGVPKGTYVSRVHASKFAAGRCYVAFDGHRSDDFTPYVFVTEDFGATWKKLSGKLPEGGTVSVVREHPRAENLLFVGTERGAYVSLDRGVSWEKFGGNFPSSVPVDDIQVHPRDNDLIFATHARGIWILDDIGALEAEANGLGKVSLAPPKPAVHWRTMSRKAVTGSKLYVATNPAFNMSFRYYLSKDVPNTATLTIKNPKGKVVQTLSVDTSIIGWGQTPWNGRETLETTSTGGGGGFGGGGGGGGLASPRAVPGTYTVTLNAGTFTATQPFVVLDDPNVKLTDKQRQEIHDLLIELRETYNQLTDARTKLNELKAEAEKLPAGKKKEDRLKELNELLVQVSVITQGRRPGAGGNRPVPTPVPTTPPAGGSESGEGAQPTTPQVLNTNTLTTRISRISSSIDQISEPLRDETKKEAKDALKDAGKLLGKVKRLK